MINKVCNYRGCCKIIKIDTLISRPCAVFAFIDRSFQFISTLTFLFFMSLDCFAFKAVKSIYFVSLHWNFCNQKKSLNIGTDIANCFLRKRRQRKSILIKTGHRILIRIASKLVSCHVHSGRKRCFCVFGRWI